MKKYVVTGVTIARRALGYGLLGAVLALLFIFVFALDRREDLDLWHEVHLDEEFDKDGEVTDFAGYLALEERLFQQLDDEVYAKTGEGAGDSVQRYQRGSMMDPSKWERDWNRSFLLKAENPKAGVLMLHGMSDSPYSMRHLTGGFHKAGATVLALRIPGHGTVPTGLIRTKWQDMSAAVIIAMKHLKAEVGDKPLYLLGYSNGGALSVMYALEALEDSSLPQLDGVMMMSPEIGVSPAAVLAVWQGRIGRWFSQEKLAWNSIGIEYDPFKYRSFAVNAGDQAHRITLEIDKRIKELAKENDLGRFPPVLTFQSAVDSTVSVEALISRLFSKLPQGGHELVLFDINRLSMVNQVLANDPKDKLQRLLGADENFRLSVVANRVDDGFVTRDLVLKSRAAGGGALVETAMHVKWPENVYSLSHIALPFPAHDTLYGKGGEDGKTMTLGNLALYGERGTVHLPAGDMLRQRWNPFYDFMELRMLEFAKLAPTQD